MTLWPDAPRALLLALIVLACLHLANKAYDAGLSHWISRKVSHLGGGFAFIMIPFLFREPWWPLILSGGFIILLVLARIFRPATFRGTGGSGRPHAMAEINFPISGCISILVLWVWMGEPYLAILPPAFMGIGDAVTGILRSRGLTTVENKGWVGSGGMLLTCLLLASLASPFWVSGPMAVTATLVEKYTVARRYIDDNLTLTLGSMLVGVILLSFGASQ